MEDNRGSRLIKVEDGIGHSLEKYSLIGIGILMTVFLVSVIIVTLALHSSSLLSAGIIAPISFLVMTIAGASFGVWMTISGVRTVRLRVYENGFIPQKIPFKMWLRKASWFIEWNDIVSMKYVGPEDLLGSGWAYLIRVRNGRGVSIGSKNFRDGGLEVLRKLKQVERELRRKGLEESYQRSVVYDT